MPRCAEYEVSCEELDFLNDIAKENGVTAEVCGLENKSTNTAAVAGQGVSAWAVDAMVWAVEMGLLKGDENGALHPQNAASRAEVAIILQRFVTVLVK